MKVVIIGNGVAGNSAVSSIKEVDENIEITIISEEIFPEYSACVLPDYLAGEIKRESVFLKSLDDYLKNNIEVIFGHKVVTIDTYGKRLILDTGKKIFYDKLIIATGGEPIIPPVEGSFRKGVFTLKSMDDVDRISNYQMEKVVVVGSGPIGAEVSIALRKRGFEVWWIELLHWILPKVFDEKPSGILKKAAEEKGIKVLTGEKVVKVLGEESVEGIITDKRKIKCDAVVLAIGIRPNVDLARQAGIEIGEKGGIRVNDQMMTNIKDVYACGDCVETVDSVTNQPTLILLWHNARRQGEIAGYNCVSVSKQYAGSTSVVSLNMFDTWASSIGSPASNFKDGETKVIEKECKEFYYRMVIVDGIIVGAQSIGKVEDMGVLLPLLRKGYGLDKLKKMIENREFLLLSPWYYKINRYI
jgi:NADH oxidase (H2O2-forming)